MATTATLKEVTLTDTFYEYISGEGDLNPNKYSLTKPEDFIKSFEDANDFLTHAQQPIAVPVRSTLDFCAHTLNSIKLMCNAAFDLLRGDTSGLEATGKTLVTALGQAAQALFAAVFHTLYEVAAFVTRLVATPINMTMGFFAKKDNAEAKKEEVKAENTADAQEPTVAAVAPASELQNNSMFAANAEEAKAEEAEEVKAPTPVSTTPVAQ